MTKEKQKCQRLAIADRVTYNQDWTRPHLYSVARTGVRLRSPANNRRHFITDAGPEPKNYVLNSKTVKLAGGNSNVSVNGSSPLSIPTLSGLSNVFVALNDSPPVRRVTFIVSPFGTTPRQVSWTVSC